MKIHFFIAFNLITLAFFIAISLVYADDTEVFLGSSAFAPDPKVLFIFDNSGSMDNDVPGSSYSRMSIAKSAFLDIIHDPANANLDMGLMLFNENDAQSGVDSNNGGRVVFAIQDIEASNRGTEPDSYTHSNANSGGDGVCSWSGSTPASDTLTKIVCDIRSDTNTPLEETLYEAYLYYKGDTPFYGDQNRNATISPLEDSFARSGGTYYSPILEDPSFIKYDKDANGSITIDDLSCERAYIVLMTDGSPYEDADSHNQIRNLTSDTNCNNAATDTYWGNCLDELSKYMFENDLDGNSANSTQDIVTHTVGFTTNQTLLEDTASKGGGDYYTASSADELQSAFNSIFTSINDATTTFTSPGTGSSAANDARSLEYVYNSFFKPANTPRWSGNLKKYRLDIVQNGFEDDGVTPKLEFQAVDKNDKIVYDENGKIISVANGNTDGNGQNYDVQSIWSSVADTDQVEIGGAGASITSFSARTVYTNSDTDSDASTQDVFTTFNTANTDLTFSMFNAADTAEKETLINWALGQDLDDENENSSTTDTRWVMGDALHSKPIIINYGKRQNGSSYSGIFSDIRIVMGTNAGFLHLFKDDLGGSANASSGGHTSGDTVTESWAFIPKELLTNITLLKANSTSTSHPYGLDSTVSLYVDDKNQDGNICAASLDCNGDGKKDGDRNGDGDTSDSGEGDDQVIIVFGMRRGGAYYYAIDVTNPDSPTFLWKYTHTDIEQSWSDVQFGKVKYFDGSAIQTKTVAIFSGGYDSNKDTNQTIGTADDQGNGLYMIELSSGDLIWSILDGTGTSTATTLFEANLDDSIPATPKAVDINDDDILDRNYLADTGGNVWRVDLFNQDVSTAYDTNPDPTYNTRTPLNLYTKDSRLFWSIFKLANLGRGDQSGLSNDRRFFNQIDFVQTRDDNGNFDAILLGSGHRNNPNEQDTTNRFYMLRDSNVIAYKFQSAACVTDTTQEAYDPHCKVNPTTLVNDDLSDVSTTALSDYSSNGWRLDLPASGDKEKNLGSSVTINGVVFFTTFSPTVNLNDPCSTLGGNSFIYAIDLHTAKAFVDFDKSGSINAITDRKKSTPQTGGGIPETPPVIIPEGGDDIYIVPGSEPIWAGTASTKVHYWFKNSE